MGTALVYILTSSTLATILAFTRSKGHAVVGGEDVFRYRPKLLRIAHGCCFLPIVCAAFICLVARPAPGILAITFLMSTGMLACGLMFWLWNGLRSFEVRVQADGLAISKAGRTSKLPFDQVSKVIYLNPSSDGGTLELYGPNKRSLIEFTDTIEDIDQLAELVVSKARAHRVECLVTKSRPMSA
ncbi:hypothetical protein [Dyella koreensis]|uniref:PH domain-containing protein n=1 Tax=Dyella koreensis TaxID=311235 RepID=A0ABW8K371_9GAMM